MNFQILRFFFVGILRFPIFHFFDKFYLVARRSMLVLCFLYFFTTPRWRRKAPSTWRWMITLISSRRRVTRLKFKFYVFPRNYHIFMFFWTFILPKGACGKELMTFLSWFSWFYRISHIFHENLNIYFAKRRLRQRIDDIFHRQISISKFPYTSGQKNIEFEIPIHSWSKITFF